MQLWFGNLYFYTIMEMVICHKKSIYCKVFLIFIWKLCLNFIEKL